MLCNSMYILYILDCYKRLHASSSFTCLVIFLAACSEVNKQLANKAASDWDTLNLWYYSETRSVEMILYSELNTS